MAQARDMPKKHTSVIDLTASDDDDKTSEPPRPAPQRPEPRAP